MPSPTATATPVFSQGPIPSVPIAPAGGWTGFRWVAGPTMQVPTPSDSVGAPNFAVFGWSRGYLGFRSADNGPDASGNLVLSVTTTHSTDGLHWQQGKGLDTTLAAGEVNGVGSVVEGPAGLLATGAAGGCGTPRWIGALWFSTDGLSWQQLDMTKIFGQGVQILQVSAGSSGYIATGTAARAGAQGVAWVARDGRTWRPVSFSAPAFKNSVVNDGTAFAGGYVLAGAVYGQAGACGSPPLLTPSLWWSADGTRWTRDSLSGTTSGTDVQMSVCRVDDGVLLAIQDAYGGNGTDTQAVWTSTDGQNWKLIKAPAISETEVLTNGQRGLVVQGLDQDGKMTILGFDHDLALVTLPQTGDVPTDPANQTSVTLGPTGLVVANLDGSRFWVGVPRAG